MDIIVILAVIVVVFVSGMVVGGKWMKRIMKRKHFFKLYGG